MKKLLLINFLMVVASSANAQLSFEKAYQSNNRMEVVNLEGEGYKYIGVDAATHKIMIYNTDHTLWKSINTSIPTGASMYTLPTYASKTLFNSDSKIEVVVMYGSGTGFQVQIYNEDGATVFSTGNAAWYDLKKVDNAWKFLVHKNDQTPQYTEVYGLPGQFTGILKQGANDGSLSLAPNPMTNTATLSYAMPAGTRTGQIEILTTDGKVVATYNVTDQFSNILISRQSLTSGIYFYRLIADGIEPVPQRFVID